MGKRKHLKKYRRFLVYGALLGLLVLLCLQGGHRDRITVTAVYEEQGKTLSVTETVELTNRTGKRQTELTLNLYPNAYRQEESAPVVRTEMRFAYPEGFCSGGAEVESVQVNGKAADWTLSGEQQNLLRVQLSRSLPRHGSVQLTLQYCVKLPQSRLRMGYSEADVRLCNVFALPRVWRETENDYAADAYGGIGDPFVSECADWTVTLTLPESYVAAGAGCESAGQGVWRFSGEKLRDFALVLSKEYCVCQREHSGVLLRSFAPSEDGAETLLDLGQKAIGIYEAVLGEYPFPELTLCTGKLYMGGMEYPELVLLSDSLLSGDRGILEYVVAHEVAHQWFYGCVGSDAVLHPWQDEALTEFFTLLYFEKAYGEESFRSLYDGLIVPSLQSERFEAVGVEQPLSAFESTAAYDAVIYRKGAAMVQEIREQMGEEAFFSAIQRYIKKNAFSIAQPEDFLAEFPAEIQARVKGWLSGKEE